MSGSVEIALAVEYLRRPSRRDLVEAAAGVPGRWRSGPAASHSEPQNRRGEPRRERSDPGRVFRQRRATRCWNCTRALVPYGPREFFLALLGAHPIAPRRSHQSLCKLDATERAHPLNSGSAGEHRERGRHSHACGRTAPSKLARRHHRQSVRSPEMRLVGVRCAQMCSSLLPTSAFGFVACLVCERRGSSAGVGVAFALLLSGASCGRTAPPALGLQKCTFRTPPPVSFVLWGVRDKRRRSSQLSLVLAVIAGRPWSGSGFVWLLRLPLPLPNLLFVALPLLRVLCFSPFVIPFDADLSVN